MSDGLDFTAATADGLPFRLRLSMSHSFASVGIAEELSSGSYPVLRLLWDYRSTTVPHDDLPALRTEVITLVKAMLARREDQVVIDELDDLLVFLKELENLGLGIHVDGP